MGVRTGVKRIASKVGRVTLPELNSKLDRIIKQNEEIIQKNNVIIKKADRIIGHKVVYIEDDLTLVRLVDGTRMYINPKDQDIGSYVAIHGFWEPHIESIWRSLVEEDMTIFDIGANFGYFSAVAARKIKKGQIHLFEPNKKFLPYLSLTMSSNGFANQSTIVESAVADTPGKATFRESLNFWGRSTLTDKSMGEEGRELKVDVITIDDYCKLKNIRHIDLMKIDIEGFEDKAYLGMRKTIAKNKQLKIVMEFSANHYADARGFYKQMQKDFRYIYLFTISGTLTRCGSFSDIDKAKVGSNTMMLLSNNPVNL